MTPRTESNLASSAVAITVTGGLKTMSGVQPQVYRAEGSGGTISGMV